MYVLGIPRDKKHREMNLEIKGRKKAIMKLRYDYNSLGLNSRYLIPGGIAINCNLGKFLLLMPKNRNSWSDNSEIFHYKYLC